MGPLMIRMAYAFIHWIYMKCRHVCGRTNVHAESGKSGSILLRQTFCQGSTQGRDVMENVISGRIGCIV